MRGCCLRRQGTRSSGTILCRLGDEIPATVDGRTTGQGYLNSGSTPGTNILFSGRYRDTEQGTSAMPSGLDYFGARHHAPALGRFMQPDPVGSAGPIQAVRRVGICSTTSRTSRSHFTDPDGLQPFGPGDDCEDDPSCGWDWGWGWGWGWTWGGPSGPPVQPTPHPNPPLPSSVPSITGVYGLAGCGKTAILSGIRNPHYAELDDTRILKCFRRG